MRHEKLLREVYWGEVVERWPRVLEAVKWAACLSDGEGVACIRDYVAGRRYSGEAVDHFGGPATVLERAASANTRHAVYAMHRDFERRMRQFAEESTHA